MKTTVKILSKDIISMDLEQFNFDILNITYMSEDKVKRSKRTLLYNYKMLVMLNGSASIFMGKSRYFINQSDCVLLCPGSLYYAELTGEEKGEFISMSFALETPLQEKSFAQLFGIKDLIISKNLIPEFTNQFILSTFDGAIKENAGYYYNTLLLLRRLLSLMLYGGLSSRVETHSQLKNTTNEEQLILKCHRYIINHKNLPVSVVDLCRECNVSQSYLYKCFRSSLSTSTKDFITETKLNLTQRELTQTDKSITEIALSNGFSTSYHYSGVFKKVRGISPSMYRKEHRG
ncbi:MAG: AraC family transcriptional regulator [Oscillospiraceae bacterium]